MSGALRLLGVGEPETFRCRVYGDEPDPHHAARVAFLRHLADGWVETEDGDPRHGAIAALLERGYVESRFETARERGIGPTGMVRVWTLTPSGRALLAEVSS